MNLIAKIFAGNTKPTASDAEAKLQRITERLADVADREAALEAQLDKLRADHLDAVVADDAVVKNKIATKLAEVERAVVDLDRERTDLLAAQVSVEAEAQRLHDAERAAAEAERDAERRADADRAGKALAKTVADIEANAKKIRAAIDSVPDAATRARLHHLVEGVIVKGRGEMVRVTSLDNFSAAETIDIGQQRLAARAAGRDPDAEAIAAQTAAFAAARAADRRAAEERDRRNRQPANPVRQEEAASKSFAALGRAL